MEANEPTKMVANASEIITRLKSKIDRKNFCNEMNWLYPNELGPIQFIF